MSIPLSLIAALVRREAEDPEGNDEDATQKEIFASWSLFILIMLLIASLMTSYFLQTRKIQAVHETVISIFAGMFVGLILRITASPSVLGAVSFDYKLFFNLLLPPIIIASGFELRQDNFFRKIGTILTFAFAGTFISAVVLAVILYGWTRLPIDSAVNLSFVDAMSVGATLSATDPVTILAIFNTYKVDPALYTVIFGESILNDAVSIVLFETAQKYRAAGADRLTLFSLFESIGVFLLVFFGSLVIGLLVGCATSMLLKVTMLRRYPQIESCVIVLIAYATYFFANAIHMSGIVSLLFCGICLKRYAYLNMSRRTQLTTKFVFQLTSQLSENFIFIYLGLSLFTDTQLDFRPGFILVSVLGICVARWCAVFPISHIMNWAIKKYRKGNSIDTTDPIPLSHQVMLFWAGLRGAVGVALAAGLSGPNAMVLRATVLIVVVLTVIIFGGTTARMLEIMNIRTGVVEQTSDEEFDVELSSDRLGYSEIRDYDRESTLPLSDLKSSTGAGSHARQRDLPSPAWESGSSTVRKGRKVGNGGNSGNGFPNIRPSSSSLSRTGSRLFQQHPSSIDLASSLEVDDVLDDNLDLPPPPPPRRSTMPTSFRGNPGSAANNAMFSSRRISPPEPQDESSVVDTLSRWDQTLKPVLLVDSSEGGFGHHHHNQYNGHGYNPNDNTAQGR